MIEHQKQRAEIKPSQAITLTNEANNPLLFQAVYLLESESAFISDAFQRTSFYKLLNF